jgi:hypothetical protein
MLDSREEVVPFNIDGVWIKTRGLERDDMEAALTYLAAQGRSKIWLDVVSSTKHLDMRKVQRTYECAAVVFGVLNYGDSQHLQQVRNTISLLHDVYAQPSAGLPQEYIDCERVSPKARAYYRDSHTFWTRIWPFAELAVAENFAYLVQDGQGGLLKVKRAELLDDFYSISRTERPIEHPDPTFLRKLQGVLQKDYNATKIHVSRMTLSKQSAVEGAEPLMTALINAPRHARDWESMMEAVSIFDPKMERGTGDGRRRLRHVVERLSEFDIVNQPMLGRYHGKNIISDFMPPTNEAEWCSTAIEFIGGQSITTAVLTRLGRVIGSSLGDESELFPETWGPLGKPIISHNMITVDCYVGRLSEDMATAIEKVGSKRNSASSFSSENEESQAAFLVDKLPPDEIAHIAARGDRYAYVLNRTRKRIVGYVGYGLLSAIKFRLHDCKWKYLQISSGVA